MHEQLDAEGEVQGVVDDQLAQQPHEHHNHKAHDVAQEAERQSAAKAAGNAAHGRGGVRRQRQRVAGRAHLVKEVLVEPQARAQQVAQQQPHQHAVLQEGGRADARLRRQHQQQHCAQHQARDHSFRRGDPRVDPFAHAAVRCDQHHAHEQPGAHVGRRVHAQVQPADGERGAVQGRDSSGGRQRAGGVRRQRVGAQVVRDEERRVREGVERVRRREAEVAQPRRVGVDQVRGDPHLVARRARDEEHVLEEVAGEDAGADHGRGLRAQLVLDVPEQPRQHDEVEFLLAEERHGREEPVQERLAVRLDVLDR
mmetsp:Transcript_23699/g.55974  ORF Transcript_23699/g.55974 Transcript_23699/m.55974 type:complete len:311 (-) Transcript_23699:348-1280(-)